MQAAFQKYFIALIPPAPVYQQALDYKNYFKLNYQSKAALRSPPHITLHMPFDWKEQKEAKLVSLLEQFAEKKSVFEITLNGFGSFPPRVIYIHVEESPELAQLAQDLQRFCKIELNLFNAHYRDQPFHPHLTVAFRDLKKNLFAQAWQEVQGKPFTARWAANGFTLLKHSENRWLPYKEFTFKT